MPIPDHNAHGLLPPYSGDPAWHGSTSPYQATCLEICQRFGDTPEHRALLRRFLDFRSALHQFEYRDGFQWVDAGYRVFHDFPGGKNWNVDHIVVGPSGVYAIETKTRSKRAASKSTGEYGAVFDGEAIRFPCGSYDREAPRQASRNAQSLSEFLFQSTNLRVQVQPIVALPGWWVILKLRADVKVLSGKHVPTYILKNPRQLNANQIQTLAFQIEQKCRDLEF